MEHHLGRRLRSCRIIGAINAGRVEVLRNQQKHLASVSQSAPPLDGTRQRELRPAETLDEIPAAADTDRLERLQLSDEYILERTLFALINEGAKILEEGMAQRASDIDVVWIYGYGWPVYRGGPMFYADTVGAAEVVAALKRLAPMLGEGFTLAPLLLKTAEAQGRITAA